MFVSPGDINDSPYVFKTQKTLTEQGLQVSRSIPRNSVLVVCIGATIGKTALTSAVNSATNQQINAIIPNERTISHFLYYALKHRSADLYPLAGRAAVPILNKSSFEKFLLPLPPLSEQRSIAAILHAVQDAREARRRELTLERERKAALMEELFTCGTRGEPCKQTEIGMMPQSWEVVRLEDVTTEVGSGVTPRGGEKTYEKSGIPLIRSQNVLMNRLCLDDVAYISAEVHKAMTRSALQPGDVLLNITGASIGRVACVPEKLTTANINQHVCRIRLTKQAYPLFISYFLAFHRGQSQIMGTQFGTTRQGLNYGQVRALKIPLPSIDEQYEIATVLTACDQKIAALEAEAVLHDELFRAMLEELMTGRLSTMALLESGSIL